MTENPPENVTPGDPVAQTLRKLTEGSGIRSTSLHTDLGPELRRMWHVPEGDPDSLRTLARVTWQLDRLIRTRLVGTDLQRVAQISYNLGTPPKVREMRLGQRRTWLHQELNRQSSSESQRDLRERIVPVFAASLRSDPPPRPTDAEIAAIMAAETRQPVDLHLPLPDGATGASLPPTGGNGDVHSGRRHVSQAAAVGILLALAALLTVSLVPADEPASQGGATSSSAPSATPPAAVQQGTVTETGGNRHGSPTFSDPFHPSETGPKVPFLNGVEVSCKVQAFSFDSVGPDGYWYRIASEPWSDQYYSPANTFLNGDPVDGPYSHNFDEGVPDC